MMIKINIKQLFIVNEEKSTVFLYSRRTVNSIDVERFVEPETVLSISRRIHFEYDTL